MPCVGAGERRFGGGFRRLTVHPGLSRPTSLLLFGVSNSPCIPDHMPTADPGLCLTSAMECSSHAHMHANSVAVVLVFAPLYVHRRSRLLIVFTCCVSSSVCGINMTVRAAGKHIKTTTESIGTSQGVALLHFWIVSFQSLPIAHTMIVSMQVTNAAISGREAWTNALSYSRLVDHSSSSRTEAKPTQEETHWRDSVCNTL